MQSSALKVTVIPPTKHILEQGFHPLSKKRVAAYARVSTDNIEQLTSYEAQVSHYTKYISEKEGWELVEVYADEGISGTNTKNRDGFNRMIEDALNGKIDMIITKSISRFARNTVDSLTAIRKLKDKGVEVYFEKEGIYTLDSKGELLITIMASLAQEESRSLSENIKWGQRRRFAAGKVSLPYKNFLGYEKGEDGMPKVVKKEAETVKLIYNLFLEGNSATKITKLLMEKHIPSPTGKKAWHVETIMSILTNEKFKGEAILQKRFTVDFLTKKKKRNEGEVPQYHVENSHEAIIPPATFDLVQSIIEARRKTGKSRSTDSCLAHKLICCDCGYNYGPKVWHSNTGNRKVVWQCNSRYRNNPHCTSPTLDENLIKDAFIGVFNSLLTNKAERLSILKDTLYELGDISNLNTEYSKLQDELDALAERMQNSVIENAARAMDQLEYKQRYTAMQELYAALEKEKQAIHTERLKREETREKSQRFLSCFEDAKPLTEFDEQAWLKTVDKVTPLSKQEFIFLFTDGSEVRWVVGG